MKSIFTILIVFISLNCLAQSDKPTPNPDLNNAAIMYNAGDKLVKAGGRFYTGLAISGLGICITGYGINSLNSDDIDEVESAQTVLIVGGLASLTGFVISVTAWKFIVESGNILKGTTVYVSPLGFSIKYRI